MLAMKPIDGRVRVALAAMLLGSLGTVSCGGAPSADPKVAAGPAPTMAPTSEAGLAAAHQGADAPEISRSAGVSGGVVVLWPRVPRDSGATSEGNRKMAAGIQRRLTAIVQRALPGRSVDVRPEPERVCPRSGCTALAVGAVLLR